MGWSFWAIWLQGISHSTAGTHKAYAVCKRSFPSLLLPILKLIFEVDYLHQVLLGIHEVWGSAHIPVQQMYLGCCLERMYGEHWQHQCPMTPRLAWAAQAPHVLSDIRCEDDMSGPPILQPPPERKKAQLRVAFKMDAHEHMTLHWGFYETKGW